MHAFPVEGNFTQESVQAIRPCVVEDYNAYIGFVDNSERSMAMEVNQETVFSPNRHDQSKRISYTQVMCQ
jgi:hypothetical protein